MRRLLAIFILSGALGAGFRVSAQDGDGKEILYTRQYIQQLEANGQFDKHAYDEYVESFYQAPPLGEGGDRSGQCDCYTEPDFTWTLLNPNQFNPNSLDGSFGPIPLPFDYCFFGDTKTQFWINTKGTITFGGPNTTFVPEGFPSNAFSMIAGFWADIDINGSGGIRYKVTPTAVYVNFIDVGYYFQHSNLRNTFQIIITDGTDPIIGEGNNLAFCYADMQWAAGDWNGGQGGFGGTAAATVGANRGLGNDFFQVGRFLNNNSNYDGPFASNDGVHWLDDKSFTYNSCFTSDNIPPIPSTEGGCDTLYICQNDTLPIDISFFAPEEGQTVTITVDDSDAADFVLLSQNNGVFASASGYIIGTEDNIGSHELIFIGTDNGSPIGTTIVSYIIEVLDIEAPPITISGPLDFCGGGTTTLTASPGFDEYVWNTNCTGQECVVNNGGTISVTGFYFGCSSTTSVDVIETEYFLPSITILEQPICPNDSTLVFCNNTFDTYSWANYLDYPGTVYGDDATQQDIYLSSGTFVLQVTTDGGCLGQRIFNISSAAATIPQDTWSGAYCDGLEDLDFCCGYATAQGGTFWLYMFNTNCNWANANGSLDIFVNGELVLENVQAPNCGTPLWTPSFQVFYGDYVEIYYDPGNSTGTQSLQILNCSNSPMNLTPVPLTGPGLIWEGIAACPSSPPIGYWEIIDGPPGAEFTDETQFNSDFSPGDFGTYDLHFFSETCGTDYYYTVTYSGQVSVDLVSEINECGGGGVPILLSPEYENPLNDAEIEWTGGATSPNLTVTQSGNYCVTISNACGSDEACVEVLIDPIPVLDVDPEYLLCDQASFNLDPISEEDDSFEYTWSGNGLISSESSVTITESGNYTVTVTNDCGTDNANFNVVLEPSPVLNAIEDDYTLCDQPSLFIDPISNDDDSYEYSWTGPGLNSSNSTETLNQNGNYTVSVSNECGTVSANFDLTLVSALIVSVNNVSLCDTPSGTLVANSNQAGVIYSWDDGSSGNSIEVNSAGQYCVDVTNACETQSACGTVALNFSPILTMTPEAIDDLCPGIVVNVQANTGVASGLTWNWSIECDDDIQIISTEFSDDIDVVSSYASDNCPNGFNLVVTANNICGSDVAIVPVTVDPCLLDIPNVVTPNDDDVNDVFVINGLENFIVFGDVDFKVFNRWGGLVYEDADYQNDWAAKDIEAGTYYYVLTLPNGDIYNSDVTVIRN